MRTIASLKTISDALTAIEGLKVFHYWRFEKNAPYCIWEEDSELGFDADNHKAEQGFTGTVDLFTKTEFDPLFDAIQEALNGIEISWYYDGTSYEDETGLLHHSWRWRLL